MEALSLRSQRKKHEKELETQMFVSLEISTHTSIHVYLTLTL